MTTFIKIIIPCIMVFILTIFMLTTCSPQDPGVPVIVPFSVSKVGNTATFDFLVEEGIADIEKNYEVQLTFELASGPDFENRLLKLHSDFSSVVKIVVERLDGEKSIPIKNQGCPFNSYSDNIQNFVHLEATRDEPYGHVCHVEAGSFSYAQGYGYMSMNDFRIPGYGRYRVGIEMLQDQPLFENVRSWYNGNTYTQG